MGISDDLQLLGGKIEDIEAMDGLTNISLSTIKNSNGHEFRFNIIHPGVPDISASFGNASDAFDFLDGLYSGQ